MDETTQNPNPMDPTTQPVEKKPEEGTEATPEGEVAPSAETTEEAGA